MLSLSAKCLLSQFWTNVIFQRNLLYEAIGSFDSKPIDQKCCINSNVLKPPNSFGFRAKIFQCQKVATFHSCAIIQLCWHFCSFHFNWTKITATKNNLNRKLIPNGELLLAIYYVTYFWTPQLCISDWYYQRTHNLYTGLFTILQLCNFSTLKRT